MLLAGPRRIAHGVAATGWVSVAAFTGIAIEPSLAQAQEVAANITLEVVTVTARKRNESIIDVPIAVTAISTETLAQFKIEKFEDFALKVPNLSYATASGTGGIFPTALTLRGVSGNNTTAVYIDDTPVPQGLNLRALEVASIEVLKGPQGTLYGQSSMGGNVKMVTQKAQFSDDSANVTVQGGLTSGGDGANYGVKAVQNFAMGDRVAARISLAYQHDAGFTKISFPAFPNDPRYVTFIPANEFDAPGFIDNNLDPSLPRTTRATGSLDTFGVTGSLRIALTESLEATLGAFAQEEKSDGANSALAPRGNGFLPSSYTNYQPVYAPESFESRFALGYVTLVYQANTFSVTSSTSFYNRTRTDVLDDSLPMWQNIHRFFGYNPDINNLQPVYWSNDQNLHQFTEELRMTFDQFPWISGLSGAVGAYYSETDTKYCLAGRDCTPVIEPGLVEQGIHDVDYDFIGHFPNSQKSTAVFGELYYSPIPQLSFTLGARKYWIDQENQAIEGLGLENTSLSTCLSRGGSFDPVSALCAATKRTDDHTGVVPKFAIQYKIGPDAQLYTSVSKGFRPGSAVQPLPSFCADRLAQEGLTVPASLGQNVKSDNLWSYELGAKAEFARRFIVSAAGFQVNWDEKQQSVFIPVCSTGRTANIGAARIRGGELELSGQLFEEVPLRVNLGVGYAKTEITDAGPIGLTGTAPIGSELLNTPEWTATTGVYYSVPLGSNEGFLSSDYSYTGSKKDSNYTDVNPIVLPSYSVWNARFGIKHGDSEWSLFVKNITNEKASVGAFNNGGYDWQEVINGEAITVPRTLLLQPFTVGLELRQRF